MALHGHGSHRINAKNDAYKPSSVQKKTKAKGSERLIKHMDLIPAKTKMSQGEHIPPGERSPAGATSTSGSR